MQPFLFEKKVAVTAEEVQQDEKNKQFLEDFTDRIRKFFPANSPKEANAISQKTLGILTCSTDLLI